MKVLLASVIALSACTPALAGEYQRGYAHDRTCFKTEYREEYVPGSSRAAGYIKSWEETVEVPCNSGEVGTYSRKTTVEYDNNDCSDGTVLGGLLGGGLAGFGSRGKDRWWAIPSGIIGGAMLGCQIDGG